MPWIASSASSLRGDLAVVACRSTSSIASSTTRVSLVADERVAHGPGQAVGMAAEADPGERQQDEAEDDGGRARGRIMLRASGQGAAQPRRAER